MTICRSRTRRGFVTMVCDGETCMLICVFSLQDLWQKRIGSDWSVVGVQGIYTRIRDERAAVRRCKSGQWHVWREPQVIGHKVPTTAGQQYVTCKTLILLYDSAAVQPYVFFFLLLFIFIYLYIFFFVLFFFREQTALIAL